MTGPRFFYLRIGRGGGASKRLRVRVGFRTLFSLALCAGAAGAALAHVAIDYARDFLLPQDTYDHLAHGSRGLISGIALVVAAVLAARGLRICCKIGAANRTRVLPTARMPYELAGFSLGAVVISCALVPAMELFDARLDGVALFPSYNTYELQGSQLSLTGASCERVRNATVRDPATIEIRVVQKQ